MTAAVLAIAAALILALRINAPRDTPRTFEPALATGERIEGAPVLRRQVDGRRETLPLSPATSLRAEDVIETDATSRAALRAMDGSSVRLDRVSRIRLVAPKVIELVEGAVYIATSEGSRGFEVRTAFGTVRDTGTQFEVRLRETSLRVRVRTGLVEIGRRDEVVPMRAGSEATVTSSRVDTQRLSTYGPEWNWTGALAPAFEIEGRTLHMFLDHVSREEGWTLSYADPTLAATASRIVLHGSVAGLRAEDALGVALATSGLQHRLDAGQLLVIRRVVAR
jgi:ferric-dicitrate binding protein FerR (iron transport regulator)